MPLRHKSLDKLVYTTDEADALFGSSGGGSGSDFTFIVDSDQKLKDWADNVSGNDYSRVLIKKGTWTLNTELTGGTFTDPLGAIDISNGRTKCIVGESESSILVSNTITGTTCLAGIKGPVVGDYPNFSPLPKDYFIQNVSISVFRASGSGYTTHYGFFQCGNLTSCTSFGSVDYMPYGFYKCVNLLNCTGSCTGSYNANFSVFYQCIHLFQCDGVALRGMSECSGFRTCSYLTDCTGYGGECGNSSYGFQDCTDLTSCIGVGGGDLVGYGFFQCGNLTSCRGTGTGSTEGTGFSLCRNLTSCRGSGSDFGFRNCWQLVSCLSTGDSFYGFSLCRGLFFCQGDGGHAVATFKNDCFGWLDHTGSDAGQFNVDTNITAARCTGTFAP